MAVSGSLGLTGGGESGEREQTAAGLSPSHLCVCVCVQMSWNSGWVDPWTGVWLSSPQAGLKRAQLITRFTAGGRVDQRGNWGFPRCCRSTEREGKVVQTSVLKKLHNKTEGQCRDTLLHFNELNLIIGLIVKCLFSSICHFQTSSYSIV